MAQFTVHKSNELQGTIKVAGDKSISHRSLMLGALAIGTTKITGLLEGEDVLHTASAMKQMGADIQKLENGDWLVNGVGVGGLQEPETILDFGNAGTGSRLVMGIVATHTITTCFCGDASLSKRPMKRILEPLSQFGMTYMARSGDRLPLIIKGANEAVAVDYVLPMASAQVKSAVLLAGLNAYGTTTVLDPYNTRDHSEKMLQHFGADLKVEETEKGKLISLKGHPILKAADIIVPGDPSSAAFMIAAALITKNSDITIENVGMNPTRTGLIKILLEMGANIECLNERIQGGEMVADLRVKSSDLQGIDIPADVVPTMIDEYPILAVVASCAKGKTIMKGLEELRVKESDRLSAIARGLEANKVHVEELPNGLIINGGMVEGGGFVHTHMDHRIAMSFTILGLVAKEAVTIDDDSYIATSFPNFMSIMKNLGAELQSHYPNLLQDLP